MSTYSPKRREISVSLTQLLLHILMENSFGASRRMSKKSKIRDNIAAKYLSDHLIYEILLRTPAESLPKFKSVCKAWHALIKDPTFATQHNNHHKTGNQSIVIAFLSVTNYSNKYDLTILKNSWEPENISCNLERQTEELTVPTDERLLMTSCNGLVFLYAEYPVLLWNPITKERVAFRKPDIEEEKEMAIACGFGFDPRNNEYKVVKLFERFPDSSLECEVLVLGTTMSWKRIQCDVEFRKCAHFDPDSVFVEGSIYWRNGMDILCFDVASEKFKLIPIPDTKPLLQEFGTGCLGIYLVELDGSLCYMEHVLSGGGLGIWKMQKDDNKNPWIMECIIDVNCINIPEAHIVSICIQNKKIYLKYGEGLACYDTQSQELIAPIFTKKLEDGLHFDSIAFTKSIVCLQDIVGSSALSLESNMLTG